MSARAQSNKKQHRPVVMVIDDNPEIAEALQISIGRTYELVYCKDSESIEQNLTPDVRAVLLDIKMDFQSGVDLFSHLKKKRDDLPIIFHSAYPGGEETARVANQLPHSGYLIKGKYSRVELLETIAATIN